MHVSHAAVCLCTRHLTEQECQEIWCFGTNGKTFLNAVSEARVAQIARSYGCTPLAAWLLDCVFTGLLHPPGFKCLPTANAPSAQAEESADWPEWARGLVEDVVGVDGAEDCAAATSRKVDIMEAVCVVSLGASSLQMVWLRHCSGTGCSSICLKITQQPLSGCAKHWCQKKCYLQARRT